MPALNTLEPTAPSSARKEIPLHQQPRLLQPIGRIASRLGTGVLSALLVLLLLFLIVWYGTPYVLRDYLQKRANALPDYHLNINWVQINPLNCSLDVLGLTLTKMSGQIPVPFYQGPRVHVALQWDRVIHLDLLSNITLDEPVVNFVNGPTADQSQTILEPAWVTAVKQLVPFQINRFQVKHGDLHYYDFHADPPINLEMNHLELVADNLTNAKKSKSLMPSTVVMSGNPFLEGRLNVELAANVDLKQPTFSEKIRLQRIPAPALNSVLAKYGSVYAKSGQLDFYSEMVSKDGGFNGYLKPYFQNLTFEPLPKDRSGLAAMWASLVNGLKDLLENDDKIVATNVPISGRYQDPNVDFFSAAFGIVKNAYFEALAKGFNTPQIAPSPTHSAKENDKINPVPPRP